jgi:RNA polymerase sigma-70 factor (ECF subfamily)
MTKSKITQLSDPSSVLLKDKDQVDQNLMIQVSRGDRLAFEKLYQKFKGPIMNFVANMVRNQSVAEELVQEIFLKVYRAREEYLPTAKFSTWFWTIARNTAFDHLRKKRDLLLDDASVPSEESPSLIDQLETPLSNAEMQLVENAENKRLQNCMQELTPKQREATLLRIISELSYEEIASTIGTSLSSVKSLIHRSKQVLLECLKKEEK